MNSRMSFGSSGSNWIDSAASRLTPLPPHPVAASPRCRLTPLPPHPVAASPRCCLTPLSPHPVAASPRCRLTPLSPHPVAASPRCRLTPLPPHPVAASPRCRLTLLPPHPVAVSTRCRLTPLSPHPVVASPRCRLTPLSPHPVVASPRCRLTPLSPHPVVASPRCPLTCSCPPLSIHSTNSAAAAPPVPSTPFFCTICFISTPCTCTRGEEGEVVGGVWENGVWWGRGRGKCAWLKWVLQMAAPPRLPALLGGGAPAPHLRPQRRSCWQAVLLDRRMAAAECEGREGAGAKWRVGAVGAHVRRQAASEDGEQRVEQRGQQRRRGGSQGRRGGSQGRRGGSQGRRGGSQGGGEREGR
ncbi:unnamed protein product [Closterium sp. Naga37s-1]|nr:unnamed protein product [Closterium sp. Naga37s-1]